MPLYLPPTSRRRFLGTTLIAGAGLLLKPSLFAADTAVDPHAWALFSDTHLAADPALTARDSNMTENFIKARKDLLAQKTLPSGYILSGDCAFKNGEKLDYAAIGELLKPIRASQMPVYLTLGNHDDRERFWGALAEMNAPKPVADHQAMLVESARANWFILDSLEKVQSTPGLLGAGQLEWLAKSLDAHADKPAIIVVHHNPMAVKERGALKDTEELFAVIRPRKQVKAYIFGHTHNWHITQDASGIHLINLPPVGYVFQTGKPCGWVRANLQTDGIKLEMRRIDGTGPVTSETVDLKWRS